MVKYIMIAAAALSLAACAEAVPQDKGRLVAFEIREVEIVNFNDSNRSFAVHIKDTQSQAFIPNVGENFNCSQRRVKPGDKVNALYSVIRFKDGVEKRILDDSALISLICNND